jgi:hypothetical protein
VAEQAWLGKLKALPMLLARLAQRGA